MKNKKGITLIALIITILVMLILAGVAISSIVTEDGVIEKTETASTEMEKQEMLEQVQTSATYKLDGNIDLKQTYENVEKLFGEDKVTLIEPAKKEKIEEDTQEIILTVEGNKETYNYTIKNKNIGIYTGEIIPKQDYTSFNVGDVVYYDSNLDGIKEEWVVYTKEDEETIEIISVNTMYDQEGNGLTLGYDDVNVPSNIGNLDKYNETSGDKADKSIWSYNNAVKTINNFCDEIVTATDNSGVRSVGITIGQDDEIPAYDAETFKSAFKGDIEIKSGNEEYVNTERSKMYKIYTENKDKLSQDLRKAGANYWVAARRCSYDSNGDYTSFIVCYINTSGNRAYSTLWGLWSYGSVSPQGATYGVRPVVTNPVNISLTAE